MTTVRTKQRNRNSAVGSLSAQLRELAHLRGPGAKLPTAREICTQYGASLTTLDDALSDLEAANVIYRRQGSGIYVSPKIHRKTIMVLLNAVYFTQNASPFWGRLWSLFAATAADRSARKEEDFQFHMVAAHGPEGALLPERLMKEIEEGRVDGVINIGVRRAVTDWLEDRRVPTVVFAESGTLIVEQAAYEPCALAVQCLADEGCRAIGYWAPSALDVTDGENQRHALDRFEKSLAARGLAFDPVCCVAHMTAGFGAPVPSPTFQEQGYYAALRLFGDPSSAKPDGLVIADDMMAHGVIMGLEKLGMRVGEDVKIAAYSNLGSPILFGQQEKLTRIEFDPNDIPMSMLRLLDEAMNAEEPAAPQKIWIMPTLLRRTQ
jgi:DNA-binding LacI/PurR family transcriptional regulator